MDTTTTTQTPTAMGADTTAFLIVIAVFVFLVLLGIWWGVVLRRRRARTERTAAQRRNAAARATSATAAVPAPPVAASPPSLADEPIAAAAPLEASPASIAADVPPSPPLAPAQMPAAHLTQLKGLGPKLASTLAELGVTRIEQIAALTPAEAEALDARLGNFRGRITRDRWIEQARLLAAGDRAGYEAEFGKLGG